MMLRGKKWKYSSAPFTEQMLENRKWEKFWAAAEQIAMTVLIFGLGFGLGVWCAMSMPVW